MAVVIRVGHRIAADAVLFARPLAEVDQATALAAERAPALLLGPPHLFAASGAGDFERHIMQQVSSKATSCDVWAAWPSGNSSMKRTVKRWRPPLTSA